MAFSEMAYFALSSKLGTTRSLGFIQWIRIPLDQFFLRNSEEANSNAVLKKRRRYTRVVDNLNHTNTHLNLTSLT